MLTAGKAQANPGEMAIGRLDAGEFRDGSPCELPVAIINGRKAGQKLYVQSVSDGDELNGLGVVTQVIPDLDPEKLTGQVVVVPAANVHGYLVAEHRNPVDDMKLNRTYPGVADGTASERITALTYKLASDADLILDLHQGATSRMIDETRVRCGPRHRLHDDCLKLAKVFGCGYVLDQKGPQGQLARVAPDDGTPAIDPELGGAVGWDSASIERGVQGVFNVLRYYGMYPGTIEVAEQTRARGFSIYTAPQGGLIRFYKELGDAVETGDTLFRITDIFGRQKAQITADADGLFWRTRRLPQVATGEYVCSIGTRIDRY